MTGIGDVNRAGSRQLSLPALHLAGLFFLLGCAIGGGVEKGIATDFYVEILALPFVLSVLMRYPDPRIPRAMNVFVALVVAAVLIQLVPTFGFSDRLFTITVDGGRTLDVLATLLVLLSVFCWLVTVGSEARRLMLRYLLAGAAIHLVVFLTQRFTGEPRIILDFLPYEPKAGLFANPNHLAALLYVSAPLIIGLARTPVQTCLSIFPVAGLVAVQFIVGSRAGMVLVSSGALAAFAIATPSRLYRTTLAAGGMVVAGVFLWLYGNELLALDERTFERHLFAQHTLAGILDQLPFGTGYGTFDLVYRRYEEITGIIYWEISHAHNEYLELVLEGGVPAAALIITYLVMFGWRLYSTHLTTVQKCAACSIALLLVHSLIDYPLRTMALGLTFAVLNAVFFADDATSIGARSGQT